MTWAPAPCVLCPVAGKPPNPQGLKDTPHKSVRTLRFLLAEALILVVTAAGSRLEPLPLCYPTVRDS